MKNVGSIDRSIRIVLGLALIIAAVVLQVTTGRFWWIGIIGIIPLGTAAVSTCPLYLPFELSTIRKK